MDYKITKESLAAAKKRLRERSANPFEEIVDRVAETLDILCVPVEHSSPFLPEWILLLPVRRVELVDRPEPLQVAPESLAAMVRAFRSRGLDLVIDYEHQSLQARQAPAAGWIKDLEARQDGLWARVEWTPQAREYLQNREYRYFSPVLQLDPESRKSVALMHVGLTNVPAIKGTKPLGSRGKIARPFGPGTLLRASNGDELLVVRHAPDACVPDQFVVVNLTANCIALPDNQSLWDSEIALRQDLQRAGATIIQ